MIYEKMNVLSQRLREGMQNDGIVELRKTYLAMTTDTLCGHCFDSSIDLLGSEQRTSEWHRTIKAVAILTPLIKQFTWIIPLALKLPLGPLRAIVPDLARIAELHHVSPALSLLTDGKVLFTDASWLKEHAQASGHSKTGKRQNNCYETTR